MNVLKMNVRNLGKGSSMNWCLNMKIFKPFEAFEKNVGNFNVLLNLGCRHLDSGYDTADRPVGIFFCPRCYTALSYLDSKQYNGSKQNICVQRYIKILLNYFITRQKYSAYKHFEIVKSLQMKLGGKPIYFHSVPTVMDHW